MMINHQLNDDRSSGIIILIDIFEHHNQLHINEIFLTFIHPIIIITISYQQSYQLGLIAGWNTFDFPPLLLFLLLLFSFSSPFSSPSFSSFSCPPSPSSCPPSPSSSCPPPPSSSSSLWLIRRRHLLHHFPPYKAIVTVRSFRWVTIGLRTASSHRKHSLIIKARKFAQSYRKSLLVNHLNIYIDLFETTRSKCANVAKHSKTRQTIVHSLLRLGLRFWNNIPNEVRELPLILRFRNNVGNFTEHGNPFSASFWNTTI